MVLYVIVAKPVKKVNYLNCYAGQQNSQQNASLSFQLSSSLNNIKYIALIPFSKTSSGYFVSTTNIKQFQSPFDSAPWTCQPGASIRNFQVMVGNENVFSKPHDYLDQYRTRIAMKYLIPTNEMLFSMFLLQTALDCRIQKCLNISLSPAPILAVKE